MKGDDREQLFSSKVFQHACQRGMGFICQTFEFISEIENQVHIFVSDFSFLLHNSLFMYPEKGYQRRNVPVSSPFSL